MSEELQNTNNNEREIDLIDLMGRFFNWFGNICKTVFLGILYFIVRNRYLYLVVIFVAAVVSVIKIKTEVEYYNCEMVVRTNSISSSEALRMINTWNYVQSIGDDAISSAIKVINGFFMLDYNRDGIYDGMEVYSAKEVTDTAKINDRMNDIFCVKAQIYNANMSLTKISRALIDYMSSDPWVVERNKFRLDKDQEIVDRINEEIYALDSLKSVDYFSNKNLYDIERNDGLLLVGEKNKYLYHKDILDLLNRKHKIEESLNNQDPFVIIRDFSVPMVAVNNPHNIFTNSLIKMLLVSTVIILIFDRRKRIKLLIENSKE